MSQEGQLLDKKSLRAMLGKSANWSELAKDCIAFANSLGGTLLIGIEDGQDDPPLDQSKPVTGDDVLRLASERAALPWETLTTLNVKTSENDPQKLGAVVNALRVSDRVKASVKEKSDSELLSHYQLAHDGLLIHQRIGGEIHPKQVKRTLEELTAKGSVRFEGDKRWRRYWAVLK